MVFCTGATERIHGKSLVYSSNICNKKNNYFNSDVCATSPGLLFACAAALAFFPTLFLSVSFLPSAVFFLAGAAFEICDFVLGSVG